MAMPHPTMTPSIAPRTMQSLLLEFERFDPEVAAREYPWADRFVMGFPLPPWQREFKWTPDQSERFITSAWTGVFLGTYLLTAMELRKEEGGFKGIEYLPFSNCVIEGQQRLKSIELYITNQFPVPDAEGNLTFWRDVDAVDRRRFKNTIFGRGELRELDELKLRQFYDLLNFGGVIHEANERASPPDADAAAAQRVRPRP